MKLIIDIGEELYNTLRRGNVVDDAILNSIPLDDIKAEIIQKHLSIIEKNDFDNGRTYAYEEVIDIINKHIGERA